MTVEHKFFHKVLSVIVCISLLMTCICVSAVTADAASSPLVGISKIADTPTVNGWQKIFSENSTENAGGVWVDKSVFSTANDYLNATAENEASNQSYYLNMNDPNNFLVSLSAIASNKQVSGYSTIPTDTVFILDLSSSMQGVGYNSILPLANATNSAIKKLLSLNKNNRVAVVLYSGAQGQNGGGSLKTRVLMPLDRYTANAEGNFVEHRYIRGTIAGNQLVLNNNYGREEGIAVVDGVTNSKGETRFGLQNNQSRWSVGTFTQDGIHVATDILLNSDKIITEEDNVQQGQERLPVMVLMSDGEPSVFSTDYAVGEYDQSDKLNHLESYYKSQTTSTGAATEFMVQLTAAYSKYRIEQAYKEHDLLFYSLGLQGNSNFATTILDPVTNDSRTRNYWNMYLDDEKYQGLRLSNNTVANFRITTQDDIRSPFAIKVKSESAEDLRANGLNKYRYYIDRYFQANDDTVLEDVFDDIVEEIILQSKYYPTYVEGSDINYGGYLSMVDTLGKYMEVKDMKHIQIGSQPFYGRNAAREMSSITSLQGLNEIQKNLLEAVESRLGVDQNTALQVILTSQNYNNLYYNDNVSFNNSVCWYGNYSDAVKGARFVAAWNGDDGADVPSDANCKIQSYYFYGAGETSQGEVRVGDMRFIEVDVVTFVETGETKVRVRIPASLIPIITYEVMLIGKTLDSDVEALQMTGASAPMRLVYEVGLKDTVNSLNVGDLDGVTENADGLYEFYTNKWDYGGGNIDIGVIPPQDVGNSYAYFEPSAENEYLYYQNDTAVYVKNGDNYVEYTGITHPKDVTGQTFYGQRFYYTSPPKGGTSEPVITYQKLDAAHLEHIELTEGSSDSWIIPKGSHFMGNGDTISLYKDDDNIYKDGERPASAAGGATKTYKTSATYYVMHTFEGDTSVYNMQVALGNNGKLTMEAMQGIRLQKIVPENSGLDSAAEYEFTITPAAGNSVNLSDDYNLYLVEAIDNDGKGGAKAHGTALKNQNSLTVKLRANQTLYIAGLPAGEYTVTEALGISYVVSEINDLSTISNSTTVRVYDDKFSTTAFTNVSRGTGNLTVAKEIEHPYGAAYTIPSELRFEMKVCLTLNGAPISGEFDALQTKDGTVKKITADASGEFRVNLFNEDEIEIFGLPAGTVATVTETARSGFKPTYWENGIENGMVDRQVTITENQTSSVLVVNKYEPTAVKNPIISLVVNKSLTGRDWEEADSFAFELQRWNGDSWETVKLSDDALGGRKNITGSMADKMLDFTDEIKSETYSAVGRYYYRVVEIEPEDGIFGIGYDKALHGFAVEVADANMDGALEIKIVEKASTTSADKVSVTGDTANGYKVTADFENIYDVDEASIAIEVDKTVVNNSGSPLATLSGFEFEIYESNAQGDIGNKLEESYQPAPTTTTGTTRTALNFAAEGTYYYAVKELGVDNDIWKYDKDTEYVTVVVEGKSNGTTDYLVATAYNGIVTDFTDNIGSTTVALAFENIYTAARASLSLDVTKTLNGRDMKAGEFKFEISPFNGDSENNPILISSSDGYVFTSSIKAENIASENGVSSAVTFPTMYFEKVGTYFYNVREISDNLNGVEFDNNIYRVVVTVADKDGVLSANYQVYNVAGAEISFVNTYTPDLISYAIGGEKTLIGRNIRSEEFIFVLTESDIDGNPLDNAKSWTAKNNVTGSNTGTFAFAEIPYDSEGTYYYAVTEQNGADGHGIAYSDEKYVVAVNVSYSDATGKFAVDTSIVKISEGNKPTVNGITFTNTYKAEDALIDISGIKTLIGNRMLSHGEFEFEIYSTDSKFEITEDFYMVVSNDATGGFVFENIPLKTAGIYNFIVKEIIPNEKIKGITYDESVYRITAEVADNGNGKLVCQTPTITKVTDDGELSTLTIAFYNSYDAEDASLTISGEKDLIGRTLLDGEFTFNLYEANESFEINENADVKKAENKADKTFAFEDLTFSEVGTYYYVVEEDDSNKLEYVKYDDTRYYITVTVTDETENGKLKAVSTVKTMPDSTENADKIVFTNTYTPKPTDITVDININKKVENKGSESITAEGFEFSLKKNGDEIPSTVKTDSNGKAKFVLTFTEADIGKTYSYILTEVDGGKANVKYSSAKYDIAVTVSLDNNNKLTASITQNEIPVETVEAEFVNEYNYTPPTDDVPNNPQTSDSSDIQIWVALIFASGVGLICTVLYGGKRKEAE